MNGSRTKMLRRELHARSATPDITPKPGRKHHGLLTEPIAGVVRVVLATGRKPTLWQRR